MKLCWKLLGLLLVLFGAGADAAVTNEVNVFSYFFEPAAITINTGDTIEWVAYGSGHIVMSDTEVFNSLLVWGSAMPTLASYKFTFHEPGTYPYYSLDFGGPDGQGMTASITVVGTPTDQSPFTPTNYFPAAGATNQPIRAELRATAFSDLDGGDLHASSQWLVRCVGDNQLIYDTGEIVDNGLGFNSKTNCYLPDNLLSHGTAYTWQVRYRDSYGQWGGYSAPTTFTTLRPALFVTRQGAAIILSWPANADGFALVSATNASASEWAAVAPQPTVIAGRNFVTNTATGGERFYRLKKS